MKDLFYYLRRVFFWGAFIMAGLAVVEKVFNLAGYTLLRAHYTSWRLLEFAAIALIFLIVLQLKELNAILSGNKRKGAD